MTNNDNITCMHIAHNTIGLDLSIVNPIVNVKRCHAIYMCAEIAEGELILVRGTVVPDPVFTICLPTTSTYSHQCRRGDYVTSKLD